jgi:hypothetical protein
MRRPVTRPNCGPIRFHLPLRNLKTGLANTFPPHIEKKRYGLWDPDYTGPRVVTFDHVDKFHGIKICVSNSLADGIDETAGFCLRYRTNITRSIMRTQAGAIFVVTEIGERVGEPMARWSARYTAETIKAQLQFATAMGGRMRTLELWLPLTFAAGFIWIAAGFYTLRRVAR